MTRVGLAATGVAWGCMLAAGLSASAGVSTVRVHHSLAATYDSSQELVLEGRIVQFLFRNPHSFLHVEAPDANGKMQRWSLEWRGAGALGQQGIRRDTLRVGDEVIVSMNPSWTSTDYRGVLNTLHRKSDGFGWGTLPGEVVD